MPDLHCYLRGAPPERKDNLVRLAGRFHSLHRDCHHAEPFQQYLDFRQQLACGDFGLPECPLWCYHSRLRFHEYQEDGYRGALYHVAAELGHLQPRLVPNLHRGPEDLNLPVGAHLYALRYKHNSISVDPSNLQHGLRNPRLPI